MTVRKKKSGRPPLPPGKARPHRVHTNLSDNEYQALLDAVEAEGEGLAVFVRNVLLRSLARRGK